MKTSLTVLVSILTLLLVGGVVAQSNKGKNSEISYADCLSQEDVAWHTDRSKSGIARTCTNSILQHNLNQLNIK